MEGVVAAQELEATRTRDAARAKRERTNRGRPRDISETFPPLGVAVKAIPLSRFGRRGELPPRARFGEDIDPNSLP
jgi:hypothetical protein